MAAPVTANSPISVGDSKMLFELRAAWATSAQQAGYGVAPDSRRLLAVLSDPRAIPTRINVFLNWFDELKAKVPPR